MATTEIVRLPMVPLREAVVFPRTLVPFVVGRQSSLRALDRVLAGDRRLFLACQRSASSDDPAPEEIHVVGTIATVVQSLKVASGNVRMLVEGVTRARALEVSRSPDGYLVAEVLPVTDRGGDDPQVESIVRRASAAFETYVKSHPNLSAEAMLATLKVSDAGRLADTIAAHMLIGAAEKQDLLELANVIERLERVCDLLELETDKLRLDTKIAGRVKGQLEKAQREYYLSEKIKAIQQELGRAGTGDLDDLAKKIESAELSAEAREKATGELRRLEAMPAMSAEASVCRTYIDWLLALPWKKCAREKRDLRRARRVLEDEHHGLEDVKERILEHLAVRRLSGGGEGGGRSSGKRGGKDGGKSSGKGSGKSGGRSILCFVGPPGVGKTSLARSIAHATGRPFVRLSLGGVRDEAEIRGHRRTYVGAFPGRIVQNLRKAGARNPVFLLDELDKMTTDFRGDPSAALLEVLDPEQNHTFLDHYLDAEFDLSDVFFIATANVLHTIPAPLQDRLETLRLAGYTLAEKLAIAERFLVPKQVDLCGLPRGGVVFGEGTLAAIIERYTREAGVRALEREISRVCRKLARGLVEKEWSGRYEVTPENLAALLGVPRYRPPEARPRNEIGVSTGLAWTAVGGEVLTPEVASVPGRGRLTVTGQLGEVMQESARAALTYVRSRAAELGIDPEFHRTRDLHIHVPEGAIPKDGPSAGIAMAAAMVSILAGIPARADVAMTGEITLRGRVLPVGGIKEKILAAHRGGIRTVILPRDNEKDLADVPPEILGALTVVLVEHVDEVLPRALERPPAAAPPLVEASLEAIAERAGGDAERPH